MVTVTHPEPNALPAPTLDRCPAGCDLGETIACWLRRRRELLAALAGASGSPDAEALRADLAAAERTIDRLLAVGRWAA